MLCDDRGDVRPDAAGDARRRRRRGGRARQRRPLRPAGVGLDARPRARRGDRPPRRGRVGLRQRRPDQLRGARAADGRLEGVRPRLAPRRRTGSASTPGSQSILVTPGYAPSRDPHHFPYSAEASAAMGEAFALLATSELFSDAQRATLTALCDTFIPRLDPPEGETDEHGFWARAASHAAIPRAVEIALLQAELPDEQVRGPAPAARRARRERHGGGDAARGARADRPRLLRAEPGRARRRSPRCATSPRRSSTRCPISAPAATRAGTRSATRGRSRRRRDRPRPLDDAPARGRRRR